jgi:NAD(P)H-nitrite reductase large subunit
VEDNNLYDIVVVGCGAAGSAAVEAARMNAPEVSILFVGEEDRPAYKRTKISKVIADGFEPTEFSLQEESWYAINNIDTAFGFRVTAVDADAHTLTFVSRPEERIATTVTWRKLVLATGAAPVLPPLPHALRSTSLHSHDIARIEELRSRVIGLSNPVVAIVGDGVLGVEVAEQLSKLGATVHIIGKGPYPLGPYLNEAAGTEIAAVLVHNGITIHRPVQPLRYSVQEHKDKRPIRIEAGDGSEICRADTLVFCMGFRPRTEVAVLAGLDAGAAIRVDGQLHTSNPDIYACGDCAEHPAGRVTHLWRDAQRQGEIAGQNAAQAVATMGGATSSSSIESDQTSELEYIYKPFRLKCEVFDRYFFSICRPAPAALSNYTIREYRDGERYVCAYFGSKSQLLEGVVMYNDKDRNKLYMQAVLGKLTEAEFTKQAELTQ